MPGDVHNQLVMLGEAWLKRQGFGVVAIEHMVAGLSEQADVIGFRSSSTALIEAKATRSDFFADAHKPHRTTGGLGVYRFYICPPGVIEIADLPARWGLLHAVGRKVIEVLRPQGNGWPPFGSSSGEWASYQHEADSEAEMRTLYSIARRRSLSRSEERYEKLLRKERREVARLGRENAALAERVKTLDTALFLAQNGHQVEIIGSRIEIADPGLHRAAIRRKVA